MPSTTNFSWTTPADTDYVKDGASAIRTLANGIDTSMAQLKGGTTGQILSKTSGTDMAFTWINNDQGDLTAITAGTGISVTSGTGPIPTVAIDTATTVDKTTAQTLTNKTLTAPVISTISNTGTLTLPTSTDTLVGRATTDTLTNKTISATSNTLTGVINNTLTTTTGDLIYASSANTPARLGIGSTNQVLTVSGGVPTWADASGGAWTSLASGNLSSTSTSVNITTTGYKLLVIFEKNVVCTTDWYAQIRLNSDTGSVYNLIESHQTSSTAQTTTVSSSAGGIYIDVLHDAAASASFAMFKIYDPANTTTKKAFEVIATGLDAGATYRITGRAHGSYNGTTGAITNVTFVPSSTFSSGTYEIYGVK